MNKLTSTIASDDGLDVALSIIKIIQQRDNLQTELENCKKQCDKLRKQLASQKKSKG